MGQNIYLVSLTILKKMMRQTGDFIKMLLFSIRSKMANVMNVSLIHAFAYNRTEISNERE